MIVQPFAFPALADANVPSPALDRVTERLARGLRDGLSGFARRPVRVGAAPAATASFADWRRNRPGFQSLTGLRHPSTPGGLLLALASGLVRRLLDLRYGGTGAPPVQPAAEFTPAEERLIAQAAELVAARLGDAWPALAGADPAGHETNPAHLAAPADKVVALEFSVDLGDGAPETLELLLPADALLALDGRAGADEEVRDAWRARLAEALGAVRLDARSVLARPTLSLDELLRLSPGDVIPISLPAQAPLLVGGRQFASGVIGERNGRAAITLERIGMPHRFGA